ncbi:MAG: DMT family transporter [Phycisphaerales bacterium]
MKRQLSPLAADGLLLVAAIIWGSGFIAQRLAAESLDPLTFTGLRFGLGALVLLPWVLRRRFDRAHLIYGGITGLIMTLGATFQQWGIEDTTAGNAAFITALYIVIVPILGRFSGHHIRRTVWLAVGLSVVGLWFLSFDGDFAFQRGDPIVLLCAIAWAWHLIVVGRWSPKLDPIVYAFLQFAITGSVALALGVALARPSFEQIAATKWAVLYGGTLPVAVAFSFQVVAQRTAPPTHTAIILSLESVFGMIFGVLLLSEQLTERKLLGAALMFAGMLLAQVRLSGRRTPEFAPPA